MAEAKPVTLMLSVEDARHLSSGMADLLCWCRGFIAGRADDHDSHPMGVEQTRTLRLKLIRAIEDAGGETA
ncbi:hypothetical protein [Methylorubrum suomiense]|uniref:Uncharacterized protein n=1 Tax=Methylorubrum suomiense TaxID=144191 RepID=A0ABQ4V3S7_9HYPH|nr:hypothetical protein [Methylorubrum suomiense]GJE77482.1 hypothetical protein BGCPKDLD_4087 [Methylorubrum suomiense]